MIIALLCVAARVALALGTETYPDEAYYWTWSKQLQLAYFDHPGLIAWSIALLPVRIGAFLWGAATLAGVFKLTRALGGEKDTAWWALALFASTPAANLLGTFATPDAPLLAFWVWTLVALVQQRAWLVGVLWGLAMLSKYNGILLGLPVLIVFWKQPLKWLLAGVIALVVTSPTIIWNAMNGWEGFRFQFAHGLGGGGGLNTFLEFVGGQFGMAGPIFFALTIFWLVKERAPVVLKVSTILPIVFFGYASLKARGEANWSAAAWLSASVGLAMTSLRRWRWATVGLNTAVIVVGAVVLIWPPPSLWQVPAVQKLHGWEYLARAKELQLPIITNRYQLSALATWYSEQPATTFGGRRSQYDLWSTPRVAVGEDALWIGEWSGPPAELAERFESITDLQWPQDERQKTLHFFYGWRLVKAKVITP